MGKWLSIGIIPALLCSCSLLPQEEEYQSTPTIRAYTQAEYELSYVQYGDLTLTEKVSCRFLPVSAQTLSFNIGGVYYDEVYVEKGDLVEKGQLLAQLDVSGLEESIAAMEDHIAYLDRSIENKREQCALAMDAQARTLAQMDAQQAASQRTPEEIREEYDDQIRSLEDEKAISLMRLEEERAKLDQRRLYAGIDGAVTYARPIEPGMRSTEGELVVSIADAATSVFSGATAYHDLLPEGAQVTIYANKEYLPAEVVSAQSLGLEEEISSKGEKTMYFQLLTPNASLGSGDRGTLTLVLEERKDTLFITSDALHTVEGRNFVYQMDENGLKIMTDVEIGLVTPFYVEILSGLSEGDNIILK